MLRKMYCFFIIASTIFNFSHSYVNLLEDLAGNPVIIESIIERRILSEFFAKSIPMNRNAILSLRPEELSYFKSRKNYLSNEKAANEVIKKWIIYLISNYELNCFCYSKEYVENFFLISYEEWNENIILKKLYAHICAIKQALGIPVSPRLVKIFF